MCSRLQGARRHVQQSAGGMLPCVGGAVLQLMASSVHLRGLGWSPPPPDNQLLLRSESRAVTGPTHVQPSALDTGMLRLVTLFFQHISTYRKVLWKSAHKVLKHFVFCTCYKLNKVTPTLITFKLRRIRFLTPGHKNMSPLNQVSVSDVWPLAPLVPGNVTCHEQVAGCLSVTFCHAVTQQVSTLILHW